MEELDRLLAEIENPVLHQVCLDNGDVDVLILGLQRLWSERPGWEYMLKQLAKKLPNGKERLTAFNKIGTDVMSQQLIGLSLFPQGGGSEQV